MMQWINTAEAKAILDYKNAWVIVDGPTAISRFCRFVVVTSPGNLKSLAGNQLQKKTGRQVFLPPWTLDELMMVAEQIFGWKDEDLEDVVDRYKKFGGIARYVLHHKYEPYSASNDPIEEALEWSDVLEALRTIDSKKIDHKKVAGTLMHLFPDSTLTEFEYNWGSTYIMEQAFSTLFRWEEKKLSCFIKGAAALNVGTFYGILFEQYFHSRIDSHGYTGKLRLLKATNRKRRIFRPAEDTTTFKIPRLAVHKFTKVSEIRDGHLNVPDVPNHPTFDSLITDIGTIFQVTSAERHPIKGNYLREYEKVFAKFRARTGKLVKFVFIVPPHRFEDFKLQNVIDSQADDAALDVNWIQQYVMEIDASNMISRFEQVVQAVGTTTSKSKK
jgi:hypothetical protein